MANKNNMLGPAYFRKECFIVDGDCGGWFDEGREDAATPDCHSLISISLGPEGWADQFTGVVFSDSFSFHVGDCSSCRTYVHIVSPKAWRRGGRGVVLNVVCALRVRPRWDKSCGQNSDSCRIYSIPRGEPNLASVWFSGPLFGSPRGRAVVIEVVVWSRVSMPRQRSDAWACVLYVCLAHTSYATEHIHYRRRWLPRKTQGAIVCTY
jgi:hypothetical protein